MMDWIRRNWLWILFGIVVVIAVCYYWKKKKTESVSEGAKVEQTDSTGTSIEGKDTVDSPGLRDTVATVSYSPGIKKGIQPFKVFTQKSKPFPNSAMITGNAGGISADAAYQVPTSFSRMSF